MILLLYLLAQAAAMAPEVADRGYAALRAGRYDEAVPNFEKALALDGGLLHVRKDLAYTLLKRGDREAARDQFELVMQADPRDEYTSLEYAFLCYETRRVQTARRVFAALRESREARIREPAALAFANVDRPLREGMAQWGEAIRRAPRQWSAHEELAQLAEMRDELALAAEHYEMAWRLRPRKLELLLSMARVWRELGEEAKTRAALAAAWKHGSTRVGEMAREMMQGAAPREEEAEAVLAVARPEEAEEVAAAPPLPAREMGERSLEASYLGDAYRYFQMALEEEPDSAQVQYLLGVTANLMKKDREAVKWFGLARKSRDEEIAAEAGAAYASLRPAYSKFETDVWAIPIYSSRWNGGFVYGQAKGQWRNARLPVKPYVSLRFVGDTAGARQARRAVTPLYLSEKSVIGGAGVSRVLHPAAFAWFEAGRAFNYGGRPTGESASRWDARGGVSVLKGWGHLLGGGQAGTFTETNADGVFASRFRNDLLLYVQNRSGYTFRRTDSGWQAQVYAAWNVTADRRGEYWANTVEAGVGLRMRWAGLPQGMSWRGEFVRGAHMRNASNPWRPNYWDFRTGIWYAITRY